MVAVCGSRLGQGLADAPNPWPELELQEMYGKVGARPKQRLSMPCFTKLWHAHQRWHRLSGRFVHTAWNQAPCLLALHVLLVL
jgi:hypothetical protein